MSEIIHEYGKFILGGLAIILLVAIVVATASTTKTGTANKVKEIETEYNQSLTP